MPGSRVELSWIARRWAPGHAILLSRWCADPPISWPDGRELWAQDGVTEETSLQAKLQFLPDMALDVRLDDGSEAFDGEYRGNLVAKKFGLLAYVDRDKFLALVKAKPHVVALVACLLLGGGLRLIGLTREISDLTRQAARGKPISIIFIRMKRR